MPVTTYPKVHGEIETIAILNLVFPKLESWYYRFMGSDKKIKVVCAGCKQPRMVRPSDWNNRKSDYCKSCAVRVRSGLAPSSEPTGKGTSLYNIWRGARQRCGHIAGGHAADKKHYSDRGIDICPEWQESFSAFRSWALANGYEQGLYIDRIDNDKGYYPDNCRWVTVTESNRNKRSTLTMPQVEAIRKSLSENSERGQQRRLAVLYQVSEATISNLMKNKSWR